MPGRVITLEINSTSLRLVETEGKRVTRWASQLLAPGMFENEVVSNPQALSLAIRQLMTSSGIRASNVTAAISGLYSLSRIISVPSSLPGGPVTQPAVLERMREVMPISGEQFYLSWQTIATTSDGHQVLVIGVPKENIDGAVHALRAAGINPNILELKTMALLRAVNREQALILNIEPTTIDIVLVANGIAESLRTMVWQPDELSPEDRAEYLIVALELTVGAYNSSRPGAPFEPATPLFIAGGMSGDIELIEEMQSRVTYPVEPLSLSLEYPPHFPASQYAVNIGLASRDIASPKNPDEGAHLPRAMNLLPRVYQPWRPSARQVYLFLAIVAAIALFFPIYNVNSDMGVKTAKLKARYALVRGQLQQRQAELSKRDPLQRFINEYQTIVNMGGGFIQDIQFIMDKAKELGITVPTITHNGNSITLIFQADDNTAFRNYLSVLRESGVFSSFTFPAEAFPYTTGGTITVIPKR